MNEAQRIVICGTSIYVNAIESGLDTRVMGNVMTFNPHLPNALSRIKALEPSVVIMEKVGINHELVQAILDQGFPVITLDDSLRKITVLAGRQATHVEVGMDELIQVIRKIMAINSKYGKGAAKIY